MSLNKEYIARLEQAGKWEKSLTAYIIDCAIKVFTTYSDYVCELCGNKITSKNQETLRIKVTYRDTKSTGFIYKIKMFHVCANLRSCDNERFTKQIRGELK